MERKDTNPKDSVGIHKAPFSTVSAVVTAEVGVAMLEGARKYGRHNYRVSGVRASVYYDANHRHMADWWEGQDIDPASDLSHVTKAIASLYVLRDAMLRGMMIDDRPPPAIEGWMDELNAKASALIDRYPDAVPAYTRNDRQGHCEVCRKADWEDCPSCELDPGVSSPGRGSRPQIDGWKAIGFSLTLEFEADALQFLAAAREHDMITIGEEYPEFVEWCNANA